MSGSRVSLTVFLLILTIVVCGIGYLLLLTLHKDDSHVENGNVAKEPAENGFVKVSLGSTSTSNLKLKALTKERASQPDNNIATTTDSSSKTSSPLEPDSPADILSVRDSISSPTQQKQQIENHPPSSITSEEKKMSLEASLKVSHSFIENKRSSLVNNSDLSIEGQYIKGGLPWTEFIALDPLPYTTVKDASIPSDIDLIYCSEETIKQLESPMLSPDEYSWCEWALSSEGGKVVVGKSYGALNGANRGKYEKLNCDMVAKKSNPSCDNGWGESQIEHWKSNRVKDECKPRKYPNNHIGSQIQCYESHSNAKFCTFENVAFDFSKMHDQPRVHQSKSRRWDKGFLASDCTANNEILKFISPGFYQASIDPNTAKCDYVFQDTVIAISHDNIKNLGHSMSDFMNTFAAMWLAGVAQHSPDITFLNIDAVRMGHNYDDLLNQFTMHYQNNFKRLIKAIDFTKNGGATACFKKLLLQPIPSIPFTWDGWWQDMPCTMKGPSSLFQRWNFQIRQSYGILKSSHLITNKSKHILLIVRTSKHSQDTVRLFKNTDELSQALTNSFHDAVVHVKDLGEYSFTEQVSLVSQMSVIIGMHGAGITSSMHMSIGTKHCCGVLEIFPVGQFAPIRGHGNMARRMGIHYMRLDLSNQDSHGDGGRVPANAAVGKVRELFANIDKQPTCVLPKVVENPYFIKSNN